MNKFKYIFEGRSTKPSLDEVDERGTARAYKEKEERILLQCIYGIARL